jgi:hypothetical protein
MAHEDLAREQQIEGSSDRAFGLVFAVVFLIIAGWPVISGETPRWWAGVLAAIFGVIALLRPAMLAGLNRQWLKLGILIGRAVSPVVLGVLFYSFMTPLGILLRISGKDPLRLRRDEKSDSYWILRKPPGPPPDSMTNQF